MNLEIVRNRIKRENRRMMMQNMQRQAMAGWDSNYHLVSDFTNADKSNKWSEIAETLCAICSFVFVLAAVGVLWGLVS